MFNILKKYSCEKQHDPSDCGVAALATVARHHGLSVNRAKLRETTGTDPSGTTFLGLIKGAEDLGFEANGLECTWEGLQDRNFPLIARVINEHGYPHLVVVFDVESDGVRVGDPAEGRVELQDIDEFQSRWTGHVVECIPESLKEDRGYAPRWKWLKRFLSPFMNSFLAAVVTGIFFVALGLITSFFAKYLVDQLHLEQPLSNLDLLFAGVMTALFVRGIFGYIRGYLLIHISQDLNVNLISTFLTRVLKLPFDFFARRQVGEILSRVSDSFKIRSVLGSHSLSLIIDMVMILGAFMVLFYYNYVLALVAFSFIPVFLVLTYLTVGPLKKHQHRARQISSDLDSRITETFSGAQTVKLFQAEDRHRDRCRESLEKMTEEQKKAEKWGLRYETCNTFLSTAAILTVLWWGTYEVQAGNLSLGEFVFFHSILGFALSPFQRLAGIIDAFQDASVGIERISEYLEISEQKHLIGGNSAEQKEGDLRTFTRLEDEITFDGVSFQYGYRKPVLQDVSFQIPAGDTVAFVGESGSGKTTLSRLLCLLHTPTAGVIRFDGTNVRDYDMDSIRSRIGVVEQEPFLFHDTVRENIAYGNPDAALDAVQEAARDAQIHEFIQSLPGTYESMLGERGVNVSGGQRQRIAIARALLSDPDLLVFDEPTNHLDPKTENMLSDLFEEKLSEKTIVLVTHQLRIVNRADRIFVLGDQGIVERGTHGELLEQDGTFKQMWEMQNK